MNDYKKLLTDTVIIINRYAEILKQNDIPFMIKNNSQSARLAGFGSSQNDVDLYVFKTDFEKAKEVIDKFDEN